MRKLVPIILIAALAAGGAYFLYARAHQAPGIEGPVLSARFLDDDYGNAVLLRTPEGKVVVLDPAPRGAADALIEMLRGERVREITVVISNPGTDRARALAKLQGSVKVTRVVHAELGDRAGQWKTALTRAKCRPVAETILACGDVVQLSPAVQLEALCPAGLGRSGKRAGDSLVFRVRYAGKSILFLPALRTEDEAELIASGRDLRSSVLAIGHRAGWDNPSLELLSVTRPEVCVISTGSGRPAARLLNRLDPRNTGAALYRTDKDGIIEIVTNGQSMQVMAGGGP